MTIPELRQAMNHIAEFAQRLVRMGKGDKQVKEFQAEWQRTFHKPLSTKVARDYLNHIKKFKSKTLKKKRGGAQVVTPAPIAYRMEPGTSLPYGNFPSYVSKGFFVPMSDNIANCGILDSSAKVPADMGSNIVGGRRRRTMKYKKTRGGGTGFLETVGNFVGAVTNRPFSAQNPPTITHDTVMQMKGLHASPGGQAHETTYTYRMPPGGFVPLPSAPNMKYDKNPISSSASV